MDTSSGRMMDTKVALLKRGIHWLYLKSIAPKSFDEDQRRREYILNIILVGSIVMLAFFEALVLAYSLKKGSDYDQVPLPVFTAIFLFFVLLWMLSRRGFFGLASYLLVGAYLLSDSYAAYQWGIDLHVVVLSYALIVLAASILVGTWFGFFAAGLITAIIIPLRYLQLNGIIPLQPRADNVIDAVTLAVVVFLIMILAWLWNHEIEKSLLRARRSESELKEERDLLEIKVEERTAALRQAQFEKVGQVYRFAEFGQLASGLFHDLLNLVNAASLDREVRELSKIKGKSQPPEGLADEPRALSRRIESFMQAMKRQLDHQEVSELFSLAEAVEYVIRLFLYRATKENIRIVFPKKEDCDLIYFGDVFRFHQILVNLVSNAFDAYAAGGYPQENARVIEVKICRFGDQIKLEVSDFGCGIPESIRGKIFEPFFTTKSGRNGTGIGLATVKKFVEQDFKGKIEVESKVGEGSTFVIVFPVRDK